MKLGGQILWNADLLSDGKTPYERRFGKPFKGPIIPFGSLVEYYPISAKDQSRFQNLERKCKEYISKYRKSLQKWIRKYKNYIETNEDNIHDTKYTINENHMNKLDARELHK